MAERRLGDVPGIDDIVPIAATLPYEDVSILEVNGIGEITAGEIGLGDLATSYYSDPFAIRPDMGSDSGDSPAGGGGSQNQQVSGGTGVSSQYVGSTGSTGGVGSVETGGTITAPSGPVEGFDEEQLANAAVIAQVGRELGATDRDIQTALMASLVETQLRNLDYGDRDSVGLFQQRDAWGSFEDRMDPAKSARMFFLGGGAGQEGLLDIPNRESRPMGDLAQDVQVSAFPERYAEREAEAARIMASLAGGGTTTSGSYKGKDPYDLTEVDGKTVNYLTAAALDAAKAEFGGDLTLMQGSHNAGGVAASGGTHDGGGVIDLSVPNGDWAGAMTALRKIGFAAWVRNVPGYGQAGSGAHIHAVLIGDKTLSAQAQTQIQSYLNNDDGLVGSRPDDGPREFVNNRFTWGDALESQVEDDLGDVETGGRIVGAGKTFLGVPHKWGGRGYDGVDGAGFVRSVYEQIGVSVPEDVSELAYMADPIDIEQARPGDLIAWGNGQFGILAEDGYVLEANGPGTVVQLSSIPENSDPWAVPYRSLLQTPAQSAAPAPYRPPAITYPAPVAGPAPTTPGVRTGGYNPAAPDAAPHQGMNSGGSKPKPPKPPTTTKKPPADLF